MNWSDVLTAVVKSPAVWAAFVALLNALQLWLVPDIPNGVMLALNGFIVAVGSVFGVILTSYNTGRQVEALKEKVH